MDRRSFLVGTVASVGTAILATPALPDISRIRVADLRGTIGDDSMPAGEFGVEPGRLDDRSSRLQAAIDGAAARGRPLFLPPGRYEVSNIRLPPRLRLVGVEGETLLVYSGGGSLLTAVNASGISIDGVALDGANRLLGEEASGLLYMIGVTDLAIARVAVLGSGGHGLALEGCSGRVAACRISGSREAGLWSSGGRGLSIVDNHVADCGDGGIVVHRWEEAGDNTIVSRNRIERIGARSGGDGRHGNGVHVTRARGVIVSDNHISGCAFSAVRAAAGANAQIVGNHCLGSGETAISSEVGIEGAVISGNVVDGGAGGIAVTAIGERGQLSVVAGNLVRNLHVGAPYPDARGLDFGIGIAVEADAAVTGNVVEGAPTLGLLLGWGPFARDVVATGNVVRGAPVGIGVTVVGGQGSVTIASNVITGAPGGAVRGMRWAEFVTGDLAAGGAGAFPHLTIGENRIG